MQGEDRLVVRTDGRVTDLMRRMQGRMRGRMQRRLGRPGLVAATGVGMLAGATALVAGIAPAISAPATSSGSVSGGTVVVRGLDFPDPTAADLSFAGCADLYQPGAEPLVPMVGRGPGAAPSGDRSLAFDLAGGDAVGARFGVPSVVGTTVAGVVVHADGDSSSGVAYVGYQDDDQAGTGRMWLGRADLSTPGGAWHTVDAASRAYTWAEVDEATHAVLSPVAGDPHTVAAFAAAHGGDGPGFFTIGFGCDGTPFNIDDFTVGAGSAVTTYDLEGLTTSVAMSRSGHDASRHGVTLRGALATDTGDVVPGATLLLEQSTSADGPWHAAAAVTVRNGVATTVVHPDQDTFYRWSFVDRPLAAGSVSSVVEVAGSGASPSPSPTTSPTAGPTARPSTSPTASPSDQPSSTPSATPSPTGQPTRSTAPSTAPSAAPSSGSSSGSSSASPEPSSAGPSPSGSGSASAPATASPSASSGSASATP